MSDVGIYIITNKINNMKYVGQSISLRARLIFHKNAGKSPIGLAIKEYGWKNFDVELIHVADEYLNFYERMYIEALNTIEPNGYNRQVGGKAFRDTEETRKRKSLGQRGRKHSEETKMKRSIALRGRIFSNETLEKMKKPKSEEFKEKLRKPRVKVIECPFCNIICDIANAKRHHFDKCDKNPNKEDRLALECPWCHKIASPGNAKRWHFDNCRHKV